jgi:hypothetical protein
MPLHLLSAHFLLAPSLLATLVFLLDFEIAKHTITSSPLLFIFCFGDDLYLHICNIFFFILLFVQVFLT